MIIDTIKEDAYNAVFGGIGCWQFYTYTIPAILTI